MRSRRRRARTGDAPPVPIATTTSPRSTTAGKMKVDRSGRSTTFTATLAARARAATRSARSPPAATTIAANSENSASSGSANDNSSLPAEALASTTSSATSRLPEYQRTSAPAERRSCSLLSAAAPEPTKATVPESRSRKRGRKRIGPNSRLVRIVFHIECDFGVQTEKYSAAGITTPAMSRLLSGQKRNHPSPPEGSSGWDEGAATLTHHGRVPAALGPVQVLLVPQPGRQLGEGQRSCGRQQRLGFVDRSEGRNAFFVAEMLHRIGRCSAGEMKMRIPARLRAGEIGIDVGAVKDVARTIGVDHHLARHPQGREDAILAGLVVPDHPMLTHGHAAGATAAPAKIVEHGAGRHVHLFAQALGNHRDVDKAQEIMGVRAQAAAIERREDARIAACLGIVNCRVGLVAIDMKRAAAGDIERGKGMQVVIIAAAHDRSLSAFRHDE